MLYQTAVATFLERVRTGRVCLGIHSSGMSSQLVELYGFAGLDFVIIGTEVEAMDNGRMEDLLRAANASGTVPIVKVRRPDPKLVSETMNYGASMVMVPHVTSGPQLEELVAATRFAPQGTRGECPVGRYNGYGTMELAKARETAMTSSSIIPIIEDREALEHLDEIAAVEGVAMLEVGPFDLSASLGAPGQGYLSPLVLEAIDEIAAAARRHGKAVVTPLWLGPETESASTLIQWQIEQLVTRGVTLMYGAEMMILSEFFRNIMPLRGVRVRSDAETAAEETAGAETAVAASSSNGHRTTRSSAVRARSESARKAPTRKAPARNASVRKAPARNAPASKAPARRPRH